MNGKKKKERKHTKHMFWAGSDKWGRENPRNYKSLWPPTTTATTIANCLPNEEQKPGRRRY